jgi:tetratricopeptide (TPR) repeat protein
MKALAMAAMLAISFGSFFAAENSRAAMRRAQSAWQQKDYPAADAAFEQVGRRNDTPLTRFNRGTAAVAADDHLRGARLLREVEAEPQLSADASFNLGNSFLKRKSVEQAIDAYKRALRTNPRHASAKRNLEIAMRRREEQAREGGGKGEQPQNQNGGEGKNPQQGEEAGERAEGAGEPKGKMSAEELLRAVAQQEREELQRMRRSRAPRRGVGW